MSLTVLLFVDMWQKDTTKSKYSTHKFRRWLITKVVHNLKRQKRILRFHVTEYDSSCYHFSILLFLQSLRLLHLLLHLVLCLGPFLCCSSTCNRKTPTHHHCNNNNPTNLNVNHNKLVYASKVCFLFPLQHESKNFGVWTNLNISLWGLV